MRHLFPSLAVLALLLGLVEHARAAPLRDAYAAVIPLSGTYPSDFLLSAAGLEFVKFGTPPLALTDLGLPTSVDDLGGFTETDPLDHRLAFLAFENAGTGGLFTTSAPLDTLAFTAVPQAGPPRYRVDFEATMASLFGGLPVTTVSGWYEFEVVPPFFVNAERTEAHYSIAQSFVTVGGVSVWTGTSWIEVENDVPDDVPEPSTVLLLGAAGLLATFRRPAKIPA